MYCSFFFLNNCIYLFLETGEGREKERERNINVWLPLTCPQLRTWPTTQACARTGNWTGDHLVHRLVLSPLSLTSQGCITLYKVYREAYLLLSYLLIVKICKGEHLPPKLCIYLGFINLIFKNRFSLFILMSLRSSSLMTTSFYTSRCAMCGS